MSIVADVKHSSGKANYDEYSDRKVDIEQDSGLEKPNRCTHYKMVKIINLINVLIPNTFLKSLFYLQNLIPIFLFAIFYIKFDYGVFKLSFKYGIG